MHKTERIRIHTNPIPVVSPENISSIIVKATIKILYQSAILRFFIIYIVSFLIIASCGKINRQIENHVRKSTGGLRRAAGSLQRTEGGDTRIRTSISGF